MATATSSMSSESAAAKVGSGRLLSLDVFRGITILAMILVNNPGGDPVYWPLDHAEWHGWTPTDLIFPFFLFIVGTALAFSLRKYRDGTRIAPSVYWRIARRTALLIVLGWMPSLILRTIHAFQVEPFHFDLSDHRIFGVLVRIALVYFCTSLIVLHVPLRGQVVMSVVILLTYWALLAFLPDPHDYWKNLSNEHNLTVVVDRALVGDPHMYHGDPPTEPEGFLSTFPAIVTALIGYWAGLFIQRRGVNREMLIVLALCGAACFEFGLLWHLGFPVNKKIWTSSFVVLTGGLAMQTLAAAILVFDIWNYRRLARPFEIVGINAIFVFVGSGLLGMTLNRIEVDPPPVDAQIMHALLNAKTGLTQQQIAEAVSPAGFSSADVAIGVERLSGRHWIALKESASGSRLVIIKKEPEKIQISVHRSIYEKLFLSWISDLRVASLAGALLTVSFWWLVCWLMSLVGWSVRV